MKFAYNVCWEPLILTILKCLGEGKSVGHALLVFMRNATPPFQEDCIHEWDEICLS